MVELLNPQIKLISKFNSPFTFNVIFSITGLPPNQMFRFWTFFPDGEAIGSIPFSSDDKGNASNPQGIDEIISGLSSSAILPNGLYIFGITLGNFVFNKKYNFDDWNNSPISKYHIKIDISFKKETILTLNEIGNVPWGTDTTISGHLCFKNVDIEKEPQVSPNGASWFIGRKIYFTGTNKFPKNVETDAFSKFLGTFQVDNCPEQNCNLQAHYDGDNKYFDKCESNTIYFDIIRHRTNLSIAIHPLIKKFRNTTDNKDNRIIIHTNEYHTISGYLRDSISNTPISKKIIDFESNLNEPLNSIITDNNGYFSLIYKISETSGSFYIKAKFLEDEKYELSYIEIKFDVALTNFNLFPIFKKFKAFDDFVKGFEADNELPQIRSTIWLLSILDICSIPLGVYNKPGESIQENGKILNYSLDIIANVDEVFLAIDCTITVPNNQKIDKIFNAAQYLSSTTNQIFIPLIVSNAFASGTKEQALKNKVIIIDRTDIKEILNHILADELDKGRKVFLSKLQE